STLLEIGQRPSFAAICRDKVDLRHRFLPIAEERDPFAVGRPTWSGVVLFVAAERPCLPGLEIDPPQARELLVFFKVSPLHGKDDALSSRIDPGGSHQLKTVEIVQRDGTLGHRILPSPVISITAGFALACLSAASSKVRRSRPRGRVDR